MSGYVRQSAANITPTAVVRATPLNNEFNALRDAFSTTSGHRHDGSTAEGALIPLISDPDQRNKVVVDTVNNRLTFSINVSNAAVEQMRLVDGAFLPTVTNDIDLGSATFSFKNIYAQSIDVANFTAATSTFNNVVVSGTLTGNASDLTGTASGLTAGTAVVAQTAVTQPLTDNSTKIATTAFVNSVAFNSSLPGVTPAITGYVISNNGVSSGWFPLKTVDGVSLVGSGNISVLPSQTGNAGKLLTTDGTNTSWTTAPRTVDFLLFNAGVI